MALVRYMVSIIMLVQKVKGQFSEERSLLRRELQFVLLLDFPLAPLFVLFHLVLKGTGCATGIGLGIWTSRPH